MFRLLKSISSFQLLFSTGNGANSLQWLETAIALVFVLLRLFTRIRITRTAGWDDYLITLSWVENMLYNLSNKITEIPIALFDAIHRWMHSCCHERFW